VKTDPAQCFESAGVPLADIIKSNHCCRLVPLVLK
jgi:hypothetical protein